MSGDTARHVGVGLANRGWSPVVGAEEGAVAVQVAHLYTDHLDLGSDVTGGQAFKAFFEMLAGEVIAVLLHAAALGEQDMRFVLRGVAGNEDVWAQAERTIYSTDAWPAVISYQVIVYVDDRTRTNALSVAQLALNSYS